MTVTRLGPVGAGGAHPIGQSMRQSAMPISFGMRRPNPVSGITLAHLRKSPWDRVRSLKTARIYTRVFYGPQAYYSVRPIPGMPPDTTIQGMTLIERIADAEARLANFPSWCAQREAELTAYAARKKAREHVLPPNNSPDKSWLSRWGRRLLGSLRNFQAKIHLPGEPLPAPGQVLTLSKMRLLQLFPPSQRPAVSNALQYFIRYTYLLNRVPAADPMNPVYRLNPLAYDLLEEKRLNKAGLSGQA